MNFIHKNSKKQFTDSKLIHAQLLEVFNMVYSHNDKYYSYLILDRITTDFDNQGNVVCYSIDLHCGRNLYNEADKQIDALKNGEFYHKITLDNFNLVSMDFLKGRFYENLIALANN